MGVGRDIAYAVGAAATAPLWGWKLWRTGKWRTDWRGRFGNPGDTLRPPAEPASAGVPPGTDPPTVLIHAVSVGETNLIRGLVDELAVRRVHGRPVRVVLAATTNTGFARAQQLYGERFAVVRWPLDFSGAVGRFLDAVRPDVVAGVELEVWPNFLEACARRGVPFVVVNGRLSERSFKRYLKVRPLVRGSFARIAAAGVQTEDYRQRFVALGTPAERVEVLDTMKWDTARIEEPAQVEDADELAAELGIDRARPLVVAGSTAPGEDRMLLAGLPEPAQLLIAPRKPEWFDEVVTTCEQRGVRVVRRTARRPDADARVFLLDTIGELRKGYALADVCVVGRSFTGRLYGSDPMEPVGLGKPTVIGPHHADFADTVAALERAGGLLVTDDPCAAVRELLHNPAVGRELAAAGVEVIRGRQGATRRHADMVVRQLEAVVKI